MATTAIVSRPCKITFVNSTDPTQSSFSENLLYSLPREVFSKILRHVVEGEPTLKSAISAVELGRVSIYMHHLTHQDDVLQACINDEKKFGHAVEYFKCCTDLRVNHNDINDSTFDTMASNALFGETSNPVNNRYRGQVIYAIFKELIKVTKESEYLNYADTNRKEFIKIANKIKQYLGTDIKNKLAFDSGTVHDSVENFVRQPLCNISNETYNKVVYELVDERDVVFDKLTGKSEIIAFSNDPELYKLIVDIKKRKIKDADRSLHNAIKICHLCEFEATQQSLLPDGELFENEKNALRKERIARQNKLNSKRLALCGPNGFNGSVNSAYIKTEEAREKAMHAKTQYVEKIDHLSDLDKMCSGDLELDLDAFNKELQKYKTAKYEFDELNDKLAKLAVWQDGIIVKGKIADVEASLKNEKLCADAEEKCKVRRKFYELLSRWWDH